MEKKTIIMNIKAFLKNKVEHFKDFPEDTLEKLLTQAQITTFEPNEAIIEFGEEGRFMGVLLEGQAEVSIMDNSGEKHTITLLAPGDIFGEMELMTGDKTIADVIGITRCKALLIPQKLFSTTIITNPPAVKSISKLIIERLKKLAYEEKGQYLASAAFQKSTDPYGLTLKTDHPMHLLVINCGSSSLKYTLFNTFDSHENVHGIIEKIGLEGTCLTHYALEKKKTRHLPCAGYSDAFHHMIEELLNVNTGVIKTLNEITAIGHRVVHGGDTFKNAVMITDAVVKNLEALSHFAPLHNPVNIVGIQEARKLLPGIPHIAVFDTSFHHTLPPYAYLYGLPYEYYKDKKIRRYGFHGLSHFYAALKASEYVKRRLNELEIAICHLGNGASVCAVDHGRSVDTSMGLTPAEGLIMGTRCGNIDPAILIHLMREDGYSPEELELLINKKSGLMGLSGISNDMREIEKAAHQGDNQALLAFKTFCYQVRKYIGAYLAAMGGLDVLVFTGGIGYGSTGVRSMACQGLGCMGIYLDEEKNKNSNNEEVFEISPNDSLVKVLVIRSNEELMIAKEMLRILNKHHLNTLIKSREPIPIPIEVSAHHVHLSQEDVEALFGPGYHLTRKFELSQPHHFACKEEVNLCGPKGRIDGVRVLGPTRKETQIEISMTEQFKLGIQPPIRESGDLSNTPGITIEGSYGQKVIERGVICALRHIHMSPEEALRFGLHNKDVVRVRVEGDRELVFGDVLVRVHPEYALAMHIDTDEANASNINKKAIGYIDGIQNRGF